MLFEQLKAGRLTLDSELTVSRNAANQKPSKLGVRRGETITVEEAIYALVVKSGNDVAVVVAEAIAGSESAFAARMTARARSIGMTNSTFRNASGLPNDEQRTTARDMAIMSQAIMRDFPEYFHYFSATSFEFRGRTVRTHNHVLTGMGGANGIKTGYTRYSGFNLTTSVERNGKRLVGVVLGGDSASMRDEEMKTMLEAWFVALESRPQLVADYSGARSVSPTVMTASVRNLPAPQPAPAVAAVASVPAPPAAPVTTSEAPKPPPVVPVIAALEAVPSTREIAESREEAAKAAAAPKRKLVYANAPVPGVKPSNVVKARTREAAVKPGSVEDVRPLASLTTGGDDIAQLIDAKVPGRKPGSWGVQLGAFKDRKAAEAQIAAAKKAANSLLASGDAEITAVTNAKGTKLYRARIASLDGGTAEKACAALGKRKIECVPVSDMRASAE